MENQFWHSSTSIVRLCGTSLFCLVHLVGLVYLVYLVDLVCLVYLLIWFIWLVWFNKINEINKTDQITIFYAGGFLQLLLDRD